MGAMSDNHGTPLAQTSEGFASPKSAEEQLYERIANIEQAVDTLTRSYEKLYDKYKKHVAIGVHL